MATSDPETPGKFLTSQSEMSDDCILPIAPPASPSPSRTGSSTKSQTKKLPIKTPAVSAIPPADTARPPAATQLLLPPEATDQEPRGEQDASFDEEIPDGSKQSRSNSLVVLLSVAVAALVVVIIIQHNSEPGRNPPTIASSSENEIELVKVRSDAEVLRREKAQMVGTIRGLEERLEDTRSAAERNQAKLLEEYHKVSRIRTDLISENSELKAQLKSAAQTTSVPEMPKPAQKPPSVLQGGQSYRVTGLRPGDTLNLRSGPGTNYSVISAIPNGVKVTVTGDAVMNGPDAWLPCVFRMSMVDPTTGIKKVWDQKCWINSYFVESE